MAKIRLPLAVEHTVRQARQERESLLGTFEASLGLQRAEHKLTTTCAKGCHHCCYYPVTCSLLEGIELRRYLAVKNQWSTTLREKCEAHAEKVWMLSHPVWLLSLIPCPLLSEGTCLGHSMRPVDCRTIYAQGDPHYCHPHRLTASTSFVHRKFIQTQCIQVDDRALLKHRLAYVPLPVSKALLIGDQLDKGEIELEEVGALLYAQYQKGLA